MKIKVKKRMLLRGGVTLYPSRNYEVDSIDPKRFTIKVSKDILAILKLKDVFIQK